MKRLGMAKKNWRDFRGVQRLADRVCVAKQEVVGMLAPNCGSLARSRQYGSCGEIEP